jgi:DNA-binding NtrC family response regulator
MAFKPSLLIEAFLKQQREVFAELELSASSEDAAYIQAVRTYLEMQHRVDGFKIFHDLERQVHAALAKSPQDITLFIIVLGIAVMLETASGNNSGTNILLTRLKGCLASQLHPDSKAFIHYIESRHYLSRRDSKNQFQSLEEGFASVKPGKPTWLLLKTHQIESDFLYADHQRARSDLDELKEYRNITPFQGLAPYHFFEAQYLLSQSKPNEALIALESIPTDQRLKVHGLVLRSKIGILLALDRLTEVSLLLEEARSISVEPSPATLFHRRYFTSLDYEVLRGLYALRQKDYSKARSHAQRAIELNKESRPSSLRSPGQGILFNVELATGHLRAARVMLQLMDPTQERRPVFWARIYLAEKDFDNAFRCFRIALSKRGVNYLRDELSLAQEFSSDKLTEILVRALDENRSKGSKTARTPEQTDIQSPASFFVGKSKTIEEIHEKIKKFAPSNTSVLISGETGSGKEVVAKLLHEKSLHSKHPFIAINCGGISDNLIESELFGYEKGAFTGANTSHEGLFLSARKGTVFLDEITSMSSHLQSALLRVLEDQQVRPVGSSRSQKTEARIIAATNEPLEKLVQQKKFRADLFYRLARLHISIPPLRERREDIPLLCHHFLRTYFGKLNYEITPELLEKLMRHDWPGNVRELRNTIERLVYSCGDSEILNAQMFDPLTLNETQSTHSTQKLQIFPPVPSHPVLLSYPLPAGYRKQRHQRILELLKQRERITRAEIIRELNCSPNTATTDLRSLEQKGLLTRVAPKDHSSAIYFTPPQTSGI